MTGVRCFLLVATDEEVTVLGGGYSTRLWRRADGEGGRFHLGVAGNSVSAELRERCGAEAAPAGAMWVAGWLGDHRGGPYLCGRPPDGWLVVRLPNGHDWMPDLRCSNCTLPDDDEHRCWVRHGAPPDVTVDKAGRTCAAGAGSIASGGYHGFLRGGFLTPA